MRSMQHDKMKSLSVLEKYFGRTCMLDDCDEPVSHMDGPGSNVLCRDHQLQQKEYGGVGRIDRPWTFYRKWYCDQCGYEPLKDHRFADVTDQTKLHRLARSLIHADHHHTRRADGGSDTQENIKSLCYACHAKKTVLNEDYKKNKKKNVQL